jgi:hypothetical protein
MTAKAATKGTGVPAFSTTINPATNGGPTSYAPALPDGADVENRPFGGNGATYGYDQAGKRVLTRVLGGYAWSGSWEYVMYDVGGRRLKTVTCTYSSVPMGGGVYHQSPSCGVSSRNVYFGGKLVVSHDQAVAVDRLGSVRANGNGEKFAYYPYGESKAVSGTEIADGREKFGTYVRDSPTQDYADQRYYGEFPASVRAAR